MLARRPPADTPRFAVTGVPKPDALAGRIDAVLERCVEEVGPPARRSASASLGWDGETRTDRPRS